MNLDNASDEKRVYSMTTPSGKQILLTPREYVRMRNTFGRKEGYEFGFYTVKIKMVPKKKI